MRNSRLKFRSEGSLAAAYLVAPVAGAATAWVVLAIAPLDGALLRSLFLLPWVMIFGTLVIAIAELILVTPFVWAFKTYRWGWLNGWSACLIASAVGASLGFMFGSIQTVPNVYPRLAEKLGVSLVVGFTALAVALTFRLADPPE
jgi:hypothetical protein